MGDAFLQTIDQLRLMVGENKAKNWGNQYLWDVRFPDAPDPFKDWFPAIDIDVGHTTLNAHNIRFFLLDYSFPKESAETTIDMTFYDTEDLVLEHWLASWIGFEWGQYLIGKYFAWKLRRKYNRYLVSLKERNRVLNDL